MKKLLKMIAAGGLALALAVGGVPEVGLFSLETVLAEGPKTVSAVSNLTYTGSAQNLVSTTVGGTGDVYYYTPGESDADGAPHTPTVTISGGRVSSIDKAGGDTGSWTTAIPTGIDVGSYSVSWTRVDITGDTEGAAITPASVTNVIKAPTSIELTRSGDESVYVDSYEPVFTAKVTVRGLSTGTKVPGAIEFYKGETKVYTATLGTSDTLDSNLKLEKSWRYTPVAGDVGSQTIKAVYVPSEGALFAAPTGEPATQTISVLAAPTGQVSTPTFTPSAGAYDGTQSVTISSGTADTTIYYTTDGLTPTQESSVYSGALTISSTTTIRAIAVKAGLRTSEVASGRFTIGSSAHVPVTGVTLNTTSTTLPPGTATTLTATFTPDDASFKDLDWSVSPSSGVGLYVDDQCSVSATGGSVNKTTVYVKADADATAGDYTVTAASTEDSTKKATCTVTVSAGTSTTPSLEATVTTSGGNVTISLKGNSAGSVRWGLSELSSLPATYEGLVSITHPDAKDSAKMVAASWEGPITEPSNWTLTKTVSGLSAGKYYLYAGQTVDGGDSIVMSPNPKEVTVSDGSSTTPTDTGGSTGGGGSTTTPTDNTPTDQNTTPTIDAGGDITAGETIDDTTKQEETKPTEGGGTQTDTSYKTADGKDVNITEIKEADGSTSKTTTVESETEKKEQTTAIDADGKKTESARQEDKTTGDFVESSKVTNTDGTTEEQSASKQTDKNGVVTETKDTKAADNSTTEYDKVTQTNDDFKETFVAKDPNGVVTEERSASRVTDEKAGTITEKADSKDATGTSSSEKVTKTDGTGDYTEKSETKDPLGNVIESLKGSQVTDEAGTKTTTREVVDLTGKSSEFEIIDVNNNRRYKVEAYDTNDELVSSLEESKETDPTTGTVTEEKKELKDGVTTEEKKVEAQDGSGSVEKKTEDKNGNTTQGTVTKGEGGVVTGLTDKTTVGGVTTEQAYSGSTDGLTLDSFLTSEMTTVEIIDQVLGADGQTYAVSAIGEGAFEGNDSLESLTVGEGITELEANALKNCSALKELNLGAASSDTKNVTNGKNKSKIKLGKNSLKGTSKKLKIYVKSKADKKAVKKQLKKAGNKKAKVKIGYRLK